MDHFLLYTKLHRLYPVHLGGLESQSLLAGLGFCFFMAIGTGIGIWHNMRCVLEGHKPEPWIARIATWTISMTLVACLV